MRRLLALIVLALSLALASGPAFAAPKADCPMAASHQMQGDHEEMDCCAATCDQDCAIACPGAVMPFPEASATVADHGRAQLAMPPAAVLLSANPTGADPPPRTTFS